MWKDDSTAKSLEVILTSSVRTKTNKSVWVPFFFENLQKLEKSLPQHCHLIPVSPCSLNLHLFLEYLLSQMTSTLSPHTKCSWPSVPSRKSFQSHWREPELPWLILVLTWNSLQDRYLSQDSPNCSNFYDSVTLSAISTLLPLLLSWGPGYLHSR